MTNRQRTDRMISDIRDTHFENPNFGIFAVLVVIAQNLAEIVDNTNIMVLRMKEDKGE